MPAKRRCQPRRARCRATLPLSRPRHHSGCLQQKFSWLVHPLRQLPAARARRGRRPRGALRCRALMHLRWEPDTVDKPARSDPSYASCSSPRSPGQVLFPFSCCLPSLSRAGGVLVEMTEPTAQVTLRWPPSVSKYPHRPALRWLPCLLTTEVFVFFRSNFLIIFLIPTYHTHY